MLELTNIIDTLEADGISVDHVYVSSFEPGHTIETPHFDIYQSNIHPGLSLLDKKTNVSLNNLKLQDLITHIKNHQA